MSLVADAGPILSFARAQRLELLRDVVGTLLIPEAVYDDIVVRGAGKPGAQEVQTSIWIRHERIQDPSLIEQLPSKLHLGERQAIVLAKDRDAALLVDEREARRVALHLGIGCIGSLRVLTEAKARGIIAQVKPVLDALIAAGLYIGEPLYQSVLRSVGEA
jgi:uncharacterized protein